MKSTTVDTITSNDQSVRLRIFDGDLQVGEAAAELMRLEVVQHESTRTRLQEALEAQLKMRLTLEKIAAIDADDDEQLARECKVGGAAREARDLAKATLETA